MHADLGSTASGVILGATTSGGQGGHDRIYGGRDAIMVGKFASTIKDGDIPRGGHGNDTLVPGTDARRTDDVRVDTIFYDDATRGSRGAELDIPGQRFRVMATPAVTSVLSGFEAYRYRGGGWRVLGSDAVDLVDAVEAASVDMVGKAGNDTLRGSYGSNTFDGGAGSDCFQRPSEGSGAETLLDVEQTPAPG